MTGMRISLLAGLNNEAPVETCIGDLTRACEEGFGRVWMSRCRSTLARLDDVRDADVDEFVGIPFDPSPEGRERTRNCLHASESRVSTD